MKFVIEFYETENKQCPVAEFLDSIADKKLLTKVLRDISFLEVNGHLLREPQSKSLSDGLFELRTKQGTDIVRIIYFFFVGRKIVMTNGFVKKTQKTPERERLRALQCRQDYLERHKGDGYHVV